MRKNKSATVLCIDDEEPGLMLRKVLLESAGYRVLTARSGREGIRVFESNPVDAVVLDYWMTSMNGLAVARELKRLKPSVPILMLTALLMFPDETIGVADQCLRKAEIEPEDLLNTLAALLGNARRPSMANSKTRLLEQRRLTVPQDIRNKLSPQLVHRVTDGMEVK